jgi:hypothetical protein
MGHTYNRVTEKYGDEIGLAYENLVEKLILGIPHDVELIILTGDVATNGKRPETITSDTYELLCMAREHAQQELDYSAKHQPIEQQGDTEMTTTEKIEKLKKWSKDNYNNGADTMVECWDDFNYEDLLKDAKGDFEYAFEVLRAVAEVYKDRQDDAINSQF